jgi:hypothetical protein
MEPPSGVSRIRRVGVWGLAALGVCLVVASGCSGEADRSDFDPESPGKGPGQMVGGDEALNELPFPGGGDELPEPRDVEPPESGPPDCGSDCVSYCREQNLSNPVNRGLCPSLWGVGLSTKSVDRVEACRRVYADMIGRFPTRDEVETCTNRPWSETVAELIDSEEFVLVNQRWWADKLLYNNEAVSILRIFDADKLVGKMYEGLIPYDQFAAVVSAHPVLTRRYANAGDRAEAVFELLMGRPPLGNERSDLARLYTLWDNDYYDHPELKMRLPDAFIDFECVTDEGEVDEESKGECTSILWGYNELVLTPDLRAEGEEGDWSMWSGQLKAEEWERLQLPGEILSRQRTFWEHAVDEVLEQYLGYKLGRKVPKVRDELVEYFLTHDADMRSLHYAVATSIAYKQSAFGEAPSSYRWTRGPLKQVHAETWIDTIKETTGYELGKCDHRLPEPSKFENAESLKAVALLENSRWEVGEDGEVRDDYRQLARALGGCPRNEVGGRFRIISILTTAQQLNFVDQVCNPSQESDGGVGVRQLLPKSVSKDKAVRPKTAKKIVSYQTEKFYGREPTDDEKSKARSYGEKCAQSVCNAEEFARPACFALLSSSEMLFY